MTKTTAGKSKEPKSPKPTKETPAAPPPDGQMPHRKLGHYEVLDKLGQGGMSVVYKGVQPSLNRSVAIKVLPPQFVSTPELLGRFDREASIVSQLNHSNIVQVIDRGKEDDILYIVMEYVDGESLDQIIRSGKLDTNTIVAYATQICEGLEYAHSMGVVHRDLKPSNILIDQHSGRVKIADFGIAQLETTGGALATLTYDGASIGTMNYMSPEQRLDAHTVDHLTDIFSFGVILYQMLTGKLPIGHFKAPSILRPDLPLGLDAIVRKCLSEAPSDRYQSAAEIRRELVKLTRLHHKIEESTILSISRLNKRQRWYALGGVSGAVLLLVLIGVGVARRAPTDAPPPPATPSTAAAQAPQPQPVTPHETPAQTPQPQPVDPPPIPPTEPAPALPVATSDNHSVSVVEAGIQADVARAEGLSTGGKRQEAVDLLTQVLTRHPDSPQAPAIQFAIAETYYAMGEKERCKIAYDRLARNYPNSVLVPASIIARCRADWDTAPRRGILRTARDADVQRRLIEELTILTKNPAARDAVPAALRLIAEIAESPELANFSVAAESLLRVHMLSPSGDPASLCHAAEILDRRLGATVAALEAYDKFLAAFPGDARAEAVRRRVEALNAALAPKPAPEPAPPAKAPTP